MTLHLLPSDYIVYALFLICLASVFYIRTQPQYCTQWKKVFQNKIAMISAVVLSVYAIIGLLDSVHFASQKSLLDLLVAHLYAHDERTYSRPFEVAFYNEHFIVQCLLGLFYGGLLFIFIAFPAVFYFRKKKSLSKEGDPIAWRTGLITAGFIWILIFIVGFLSTQYHIFGTNKIGQDMLYQSIKSIRTGLLIGTLTTIFMLPFALFFGLIAGYFGGIVDDIIQYTYTTLSSIPGVLLITAMVLVMQVIITKHPDLFPTIADRADARLLTLCFILGITSWASLCRLLRAETLKLREQDFVIAAITMGARKMPIIFRHILPNVMHIVLITIVLDFSGLVLAEAILSYVGVGVDPTTASWGNMINTSRLELAREPMVWWPLFAALSMMFFLVLSANLFSDSVRDAFDPRTNS